MKRSIGRYFGGENKFQFQDTLLTQLSKGLLQQEFQGINIGQNGILLVKKLVLIHIHQANEGDWLLEQNMLTY